MRSTTILLLVPLLFAGCGGDSAPEDTGPMYLNIGPERWAELITSDNLDTRQTEANRLGRGRTDSIPVVMALLDHENPKVVVTTFFCLEASLKKVKRNGHDVTPWIPVIDKALASENPRVAELAPELKATYVGE
jgi:hypothetical protein